jgi:hypothetical protein
MSGPAGERCADCYYAQLYWDEDKEDPYLCRRYPPNMPAPKGDYKETPMPPVVSSNGWCGEYRVRVPQGDQP